MLSADALTVVEPIRTPPVVPPPLGPPRPGEDALRHVRLRLAALVGKDALLLLVRTPLAARPVWAALAGDGAAAAHSLSTVSQAESVALSALVPVAAGDRTRRRIDSMN